MSFTQHIILRNKVLATIERGPVLVEREWWKPVGFALFCAVCCELWAKCPIPGHRSRVFVVGCRPEHANGALDYTGVIEQPGGVDPPFTAALPRSILIHNTLAQIAHYEYYRSQPNSGT